MLFQKKKKTEKVPFQEYIRLKELRNKRRFRFEPYPWPVSVAIGIPLIIALGLILEYIFYIRNITK